MKNLKYMMFGFVFLLAVGIVSAGWFGGITGNVVDYTIMADIEDKCSDEDGGIFSNSSGVVTRYLSWGRTKTYSDVCSKSKKSLKEYYCNTRGKLKSKRISCGDSGCVDGACKSEAICIDADNKVTNTFGKEFADRCSDNVWKDYFCNSDGTVNITRTTCSAGCDNNIKGCIGVCSGDTDVANDVDIPGMVLVGNMTKLDECVLGKNRVQQYKCVGDKTRSAGIGLCSSGKVCRDSSDGAYCEVTAGTSDVATVADDVATVSDDVATVSDTVATQVTTISTLEGQVAALQVALCSLDGSFAFC